jgi:hypothetical protein
MGALEHPKLHKREYTHETLLNWWGIVIVVALIFLSRIRAGGAVSATTGTVALGSPEKEEYSPVNTNVTFSSGHSMILTGVTGESANWEFINGFAETPITTRTGTVNWPANYSCTLPVSYPYMANTRSFSLTGLKVAFAKDKLNGAVPAPTATYTTYKNFYTY